MLIGLGVVLWYHLLLSEVSLHAPRSSCKTSHNTQSVKTFQLSGGRDNYSSLCSLYTHYCTTHCAHMHPPTIYATLLCMHNQQTNRVFPSPRLSHVLHNSRQLGRNSGPPPQDSGVCMKCGYYLTTTHPFLIDQTKLPYLCHTSVVFPVYTGGQTRRRGKWNSVMLFHLSFLTGRQLASAYRGGGGGGALQQQVRAFTNYGR